MSMDHILLVQIGYQYIRNFLSSSLVIFIRLLFYKTTQYAIDCLDQQLSQQDLLDQYLEQYLQEILFYSLRILLEVSVTYTLYRQHNLGFSQSTNSIKLCELCLVALTLSTNSTNYCLNQIVLYFVLRKTSTLDRALRLPTILLLVQFSREPAVRS